MGDSIRTISSTHTYQGRTEINFFRDEKGALAVTLDNEKLHIRSVELSEKDCSSYATLFGDQEVMSKFGTGQTKTREDIETRIRDVWVSRWLANDPYSGLAVFKQDIDDFLGHVVLGHGNSPGQSELAYLFMKNHWRQGFGTEAVSVVVQEYAPATIKEGYTLDGKTLETITATARFDNPASIKILEKIGMHKVKEEEIDGALRGHFSIDIRNQEWL